MAVKMMRLSQVARKLNIGKYTIIEFLDSKGFKVEDNPNFKIGGEQLELLFSEFADSALDKEEASSLTIGSKFSENVIIDKQPELTASGSDEEEEVLIKGNQLGQKEELSQISEAKTATETSDSGFISEKPKLQGIKVVGKIDLDKKPKKQEEERR